MIGVGWARRKERGSLRTAWNGAGELHLRSKATEPYREERNNRRKLTLYS